MTSSKVAIILLGQNIKEINIFTQGAPDTLNTIPVALPLTEPRQRTAYTNQTQSRNFSPYIHAKPHTS